MAHYLHRAFSDDPSVHVLHGLRLEDGTRPEQDGSPGVCQIDHLLVHAHGAFVVESKSVTGEVRVRPDGSGGDEWSRVNSKGEQGMASPIRQAERQADFLRAYVRRHDKHLLGRAPVGLRTLARVVAGSDQRGFGAMPIQVIVAISDTGTIRRLDGWKEPTKPFQVFVTKADLAPGKIAEELRRHRQVKALRPLSDGDYGLWRMTEQEASQVAEFLEARHVDLSGGQRRRADATAAERRQGSDAANGLPATPPSCRHCDSIKLTASWGKYGYYWRCSDCGKNTSMPAICSACGAKGSRNAGPKIHKQGKRYFRACRDCGASETIWTEGWEPDGMVRPASFPTASRARMTGSH